MIIRPVTEADRPAIEAWIKSEPTHKHTADFYYEPNQNSVIYETDGCPLFVIRYSSVLRTDIDFNPDVPKEEIGTALREGFLPVAEQAAAQGFREMTFCSVSKGLINLFGKFGFTHEPNDYRKLL